MIPGVKTGARSHVQGTDVRVDDDIAGETDEYPKCEEDEVKLVLDRDNV